jgi:hypothetical protein
MAVAFAIQAEIHLVEFGYTIGNLQQSKHALALTNEPIISFHRYAAIIQNIKDFLPLRGTAKISDT